MPRRPAVAAIGEDPRGAEFTPPVSPTMQCVINLAFQYFFIYILLWIFITVEDFTDMDLEFVRDAIETAKSTVQFAPMLCVLFIATRMRALQITNNKGHDFVFADLIVSRRCTPT